MDCSPESVCTRYILPERERAPVRPSVAELPRSSRGFEREQIGDARMFNA